jgi:hypothetical protein
MSITVNYHDYPQNGPITIEWVKTADCPPHFRLRIGHELTIFPTVERLSELHGVIGLALLEHERETSLKEVTA